MTSPATRDLLWLDGEVRSINAEARTVDVVISTEGKVMTRNGPEVLRASGLLLDKRRNNPTPFLFHHDTTKPLGSISNVRVVGTEVLGTAAFARTPDAEPTWTLYRDGHMRGISAGYVVDRTSIRRLGPGEVDGEGASRVVGPAMVVNRWSLLEGSALPLQADPDAGVRARAAFYDSLAPSEAAPLSQRNATMSDSLTNAMSGGVSPAPGTVPVTQTAAPTPAPATIATAAAGPVQARVLDLQVEIAAREQDALTKRVLSITPPGFEREAREAILEGLAFDDIRKRLLEKFRAAAKPVGTCEPAPIQTTGQRSAETVKLEQAALTPEAVHKALTGLRS